MLLNAEEIRGGGSFIFNERAPKRIVDSCCADFAVCGRDKTEIENEWSLKIIKTKRNINLVRLVLMERHPIHRKDQNDSIDVNHSNRLKLRDFEEFVQLTSPR